MTDPTFNVSEWDAKQALVDVHKNISQAPVFNLYVSGDIKNSNENVLVVNVISLFMQNGNENELGCFWYKDTR